MDSSAELPVLHINYGPGDDGGTEAALDVWAAGLVYQPDIVLTHATALDQLGEEPTDENHRGVPAEGSESRGPDDLGPRPVKQIDGPIAIEVGPASTTLGWFSGAGSSEAEIPG